MYPWLCPRCGHSNGPSAASCMNIDCRAVGQVFTTPNTNYTATICRFCEEQQPCGKMHAVCSSAHIRDNITSATTSTNTCNSITAAMNLSTYFNGLGQPLFGAYASGGAWLNDELGERL